MAFPSNPGAIPAMNPNAGMSEQEQQMVKAVRLPEALVSPQSSLSLYLCGTQR
jgi:hypothetical protein